MVLFVKIDGAEQRTQAGVLIPEVHVRVNRYAVAAEFIHHRVLLRTVDLQGERGRGQIVVNACAFADPHPVPLHEVFQILVAVDAVDHVSRRPPPEVAHDDRLEGKVVRRVAGVEHGTMKSTTPCESAYGTW